MKRRISKWVPWILYPSLPCAFSLCVHNVPSLYAYLPTCPRGLSAYIFRAYSIMCFSLWFRENALWKVSLFRVILVRIFSYSHWIRRDTPYLSLYSVRMRENADQNNSECGHFLRSVKSSKLSKKLVAEKLSFLN